MNIVLPLPPGAGWLILAGGGEFSFGETREIDELALSKMPAGNRRVAFVPAASGSNEYATHLGSYLLSLSPDLQVVNVPVYRPRDARRGKNLDLLRSAGMVYIGGGVTNSIVDAMRGSPAVDILRSALASGGVVFAIGAGASACGAFAADMRSPGRVLPGLGLIPETAIDTGFEPGNDVRLRRLASVPEVRLAVGIPRGTALVAGPGGSVEIVGTGQIGIVRK